MHVRLITDTSSGEQEYADDEDKTIIVRIPTANK